MKVLLSFVIFVSVVVDPQYLFSQNLSESQNTDTYSNFKNYLNFEVKLVDFENSLHVNDLKTTEFQIENGFHYNINRLFSVSLGINGGVILGIPYEDRLQAYFNSGNISNIDTFLQYYYEIDYLDQTLSKTRYYIGLHPQISFNITEKWQIQAGTEIRYYFQAFFEERSYFGNTIKEDGLNYILLGNIGVNYLLTEHISLGINYDRGLTLIRDIRRINSGGNSSYNSSVRYHSLGLNISYSF